MNTIMTYLCTKSFIPGFIALRNSISKNTSKDYIFSVVATEELKPNENYINKYISHDLEKNGIDTIIKSLEKNFL